MRCYAAVVLVVSLACLAGVWSRPIVVPFGLNRTATTATRGPAELACSLVWLGLTAVALWTKDDAHG